MIQKDYSCNSDEILLKFAFEKICLRQRIQNNFLLSAFTHFIQCVFFRNVSSVVTGDNISVFFLLVTEVSREPCKTGINKLHPKGWTGELIYVSVKVKNFV